MTNLTRPTHNTLVKNSDNEWVGFNSAQESQLSDEKKLIVGKKAYEQTMNMCNGLTNMSNGDAQFYSRLMAYFYPNILMKKFPQLRFREYTDIQRAAPYSTKVVFEMYDQIGFPKAKSHRAGDIGIVDTSVDEMDVPVRSITGGLRWDYVEFKAASELADAKSKIAKLAAMRRYFEQELNSWFFYGDSEYGITGLLNDPSVPKAVVPTSWDTATGEQMLNDLLSAYTTMVKNSNTVFTPDRMYISLNMWSKVFGQPRSIYSNMTILQWVTENLPGITSILADPYLDTAGAAGKGAIVVTDKKPDNHNMVIPMEMTGLPPRNDGTDYVFPFIARATGFNLIYADSVFILENK